MSKDLREERRELFEETKRIYSTDKRLVDSISFPNKIKKLSQKMRRSLFQQLSMMHLQRYWYHKREALRQQANIPIKKYVYLILHL